MNTIWIKHEKLCKILIILTFICLFIGIGRVLFPYYAQQTRFSGSIIGWYVNVELTPCFVIKDPNHLEHETILDISAVVPENYNIYVSAFTEEGLYFYL